MAPMLVVNLDDRIIAANDAFCQMIGYRSEELIGLDPAVFTPSDDVAVAALSGLLNGGPGDGLHVIGRHVRRDGETIFVEVKRTAALDGDGRVLYHLISERDVTGAVRKDNVLRLLSEVNRMAMLASDEALFLQRLCDAIVEVGGYAVAWIGVASVGDGTGVDLVCASGATDYLFADVDRWWGSAGSGEGAVGRVLRTGVSHIVADLRKDSVSEHWRERAYKYGLGSAIIIPDRLETQRAVLGIYDRSVQAFDEATVQGLEEVVRAAELAVVHVRSVRETEKALAQTITANTNLRESQFSLTESEQRFRLSFEDNMAPMAFRDQDNLIIAINDAFCEMVGFTREEILGKDSSWFTHPKDIDLAERIHERLADGEISQARFVKRYLHKDGRVVVAEVSRSAARDDDGKTLYYVSSERDISDQTSLSRALQAVTRVSQILVHATEEDSLVSEICQVIVTTGGYPLAWVGYLESNEGDVVTTVAAAGETGFLDNIRVTSSDDETGRGPTGVAIRSGTLQVLGQIAKANWPETWKTSADDHGLRSVCAFPLVVSGSTVGALTIYASELNAFGEKEVTLLGEMVDELAYGIGRLRDTQRLARNEQLLREGEERFRLAFEQNAAPMVFNDLEDRAIAVNEAFCRMIGFPKEELLGRDSSQYTHPEDMGITQETLNRMNANEVEQVRYEKRYLHKDGRIIISEVSRSPARDASGKTLYYVASERDVTEERELAKQLSHQALHDPLTGLANRVLFGDRLDQAHARMARQGGFGAVLLLDLDDFKGVNDSYGHLVGDQLLVGIARRFELVTRTSDTISRFGGDEFLYLVEDLASPTEVEEVVKRLLDALEEPFTFEGVNFVQRASIGVVIWDGDDVSDPSEFVQNADIALYEAKVEGKNRYVVFAQSMHDVAMNRFTLVQELRHALLADQLAMHYQPIINLDSGTIVGFEALMRWHHPVRGWVPPDVFIPLAEQSTLILELGSFALNEAIAAACSWEPAHDEMRGPYVTVNFSAQQFQDPSLVAMIGAALEYHGLTPQRLVIEITEGVTLKDTLKTMDIIERLNRLGVHIALDDFGTGYSSLSYLVRLQPRIIKIDKYFVSPPVGGSQNDALLETVVSLGNKLGMTMVAEGIETREQLTRLRELQCELGQGFLFSPAVPAEEAASMMSHTFHFRP